LVETVTRVGDQGGVCIAAHPGARVKTSLSPRVLRQALQDADVRKVLLGIEAYNAGLVYSRSNAMAFELAGELRVARVGSSDAHLLENVGWGATEFAGFFADDLRRALERRSTRVCKRRSTSGVDKVLHWVPRILLRRLGWVTTTRGPSGPVQLGRLTNDRRGWAADPALASENL
jgi:hypothetical protein